MRDSSLHVVNVQEPRSQGAHGTTRQGNTVATLASSESRPVESATLFGRSWASAFGEVFASSLPVVSTQIKQPSAGKCVTRLE